LTAVIANRSGALGGDLNFGDRYWEASAKAAFGRKQPVDDHRFRPKAGGQP